MRITSKGQVTIPQAIREKAGLLPGTDVAFELVGEEVRIVKAPNGRQGEPGGAAGSGSCGTAPPAKPRLSTDEIMRLTRGEE